MFGRFDLVYRECPTCHGTGRNPRKRKRECPTCQGSGEAAYCGNCGGLYGVDCVDTKMDQTYCEKPKPE